MPSLVEEIITELSDQLEALLPAYTEAKYRYNLELNSGRHNTDRYTIRPRAAGTVTGTNRTVTIDHDFEVVLMTNFTNVSDCDDNLNTQILHLYEGHETLYKAFFERNLDIARVIVVSEIDIDSPLIDNENSIVSLVATYKIKYRTE